MCKVVLQVYLELLLEALIFKRHEYDIVLGDVVCFRRVLLWLLLDFDGTICYAFALRV